MAGVPGTTIRQPSRAGSPLNRAGRPVVVAALARAPLAAQAGLGATAAFITCALLVPLYGLRHARLRIPLFYEGDANFHGMLFKAVLKNGWYYDNPLLSAPDGQRFRDFPMPDNLHLAIVWALRPFTDSYAVAINLYFLAGFALTAFFTTLLVRRLRLSPVVSVVIGILYSLAPYHFSRNEHHLFLASYWTVPFGVYLAMGVLGHVPLFPKRIDRTGAASWLTPTGATTVAMAVLVASGSAYYGAFSAILIATAGIGVAVRDRRPSCGFPAVALIAVLFGTVLLNLAPHLLYARSHGSNEQAVVRTPGGTEHYSLKLTQLLLPMQEHRVPSMGSVTARYLREFPLPSESHPIGTLAAAGLIGMVGGLFLALTRHRPFADERFPALILFTVVSLLVAMTGGLSSLFELMVMPILRGWNRFAIFIMLFGLVAVGLLLDKLSDRLGPSRRWLWIVISVLVTSFGVWDQTSPQFRPAYADNGESFSSDREFMRRIEAVLPLDAMVFQLPAMEFPEAGPRNDMIDYDHLRGFLHSDRLRWSYGGVRGRLSADWPVLLADEPMTRLLPKIVAVGYRGIYVDRYGYADNGRALEEEISSIVSSDPFVSLDSRLSFFDLQPYGALFLASITDTQATALRRSALLPIEVKSGSGFYGEESQDGRSWRWAAPSAALEVQLPAGEARDVLLSFGSAAPGADTSNLRLRLSGATVAEIPLGRARQDHAVALRLSPGRSMITFITDAPLNRPPGEVRDLRVQFFELRVDDAQAEAVFESLEPPD